MSTSLYSLDLRERVIKFLEDGNNQKSASKLFKLNPSTISRWYLRYKKEGYYKPRVSMGRAPSVKAEAVKIIVEANPNFKTSDMGKYLGISGAGAFY